ncbi:hypothetical protein TNIN_218391 [Trichonephila inaurata madagascariensis]|uniref:Uncharacterized protein n=1 Tax=Trichonephila inaurata madagascariensis TaxID=2747483 RepID=A0A8X6XIP5_9ARAC|nr:hypothetical protein TNIN_218391 [Trichonephila inaurata madagascariensis]
MQMETEKSLKDAQREISGVRQQPNHQTFERIHRKRRALVSYAIDLERYGLVCLSHPTHYIDVLWDSSLNFEKTCPIPEHPCQQTTFAQSVQHGLDHNSVKTGIDPLQTFIPM